MGLFKDCGCGCDGKKQEKKLLISIMAGLLFFIIANPDTFRLMRRILGKWVSGPNGCPTTKGLVLHTIVYILVSWGMMNVSNEAYTIPSMGGVKEPEPEPEPEVKPKLMPKPEVEKPVRMADMPTPTPGKMDVVGFTDSGAMYGSMDVNEGVDLPGLVNKKKSTSCACTDGSEVTISR